MALSGAKSVVRIAVLLWLLEAVNTEGAAMSRQWSDRDRWSSARKKVWEAVESGLGKGPLPKRLGYAANDLWILRADKAAVEGMPDRARERFEKILVVIDGHRHGGQHAPPTIEVGDDVGNELLLEIFRLYVDLNDGI